MHHLSLTTLQPAHFEPLEQLQRDSYPTLGAQELMRAEHFASQYEVFAEGQIVVLDGSRVIGQGSGFFVDFDFDNHRHTFAEMCDHFYFRNHQPDGEYYYGADISVHPDYRGQGIGKLIYQARKDLVKRYNRRGIIAGGMLPGYVHYKHEMPVHCYVEQVIANQLFDPTLSFQLKQGFQVRGLLEDYLDDSASDNWATLIFWPNPSYVGE
ncbi:MAG: GNAT family N-acetyltransferase [Anaerolineales bacterium]|nr:GNAT family N-acetyltransferase [Anaerolineales bacterium]